MPVKYIYGDKREAQMMNFYDKNGIALREFDLVKVFHFIGARRKRHYMYKLLIRDDNGGLCINHLDHADSTLVPLEAITKTVDGRHVWPEAEIVQSTFLGDK